MPRTPEQPDEPLLQDLDALRKQLDARAYPGPAFVVPPARPMWFRRLLPTAAVAAGLAAAVVLAVLARQTAPQPAPRPGRQTNLPANAPVEDPATTADRLAWEVPATPALPENAAPKTAGRIRLPIPGSLLPRTTQPVTVRFTLPRITVPPQTERSTDDDETNQPHSDLDPAGGCLAGLGCARPVL